MERPSKSYILLHDCLGLLEINSLAVGLPPKTIPTQAFKGELFEVLPKAKQPRDSTRVALTGIDRKSLRLECSKKDIIPFSRRVNIPLRFPNCKMKHQAKIARILNAVFHQEFRFTMRWKVIQRVCLVCCRTQEINRRPLVPSLAQN